MSVENAASNVVNRRAGFDFSGPSVVVSSSPLFRRRNLSRSAMFKESIRLHDFVSQLEHLVHGPHDFASAHELAADEGFADCLFTAATREELIALIAQRFRQNDNVWDGGVNDHGVLVIIFWKDDSHSPVR